MNSPHQPKTTWRRSTYAQFAQIIQEVATPIVLLEGSRDVPPAIAATMERLAAQLMRSFPAMVARSGNATGSDQAWARGINAVAPERLQLVLPVPNYRVSTIAPANQTIALQEVPADDYSSAKSQSREHYVSGRRSGLSAYDGLPDYKQNYLDRDALKVLGTSDYCGKRQKATVALFYLNPAKAQGGGTGHTVRLCEANRVPYFLSQDWLSWADGA